MLLECSPLLREPQADPPGRFWEQTCGSTSVQRICGPAIRLYPCRGLSVRARSENKRDSELRTYHPPDPGLAFVRIDGALQFRASTIRQERHTHYPAPKKALPATERSWLLSNKRRSHRTLRPRRLRKLRLSHVAA